MNMKEAIFENGELVWICIWDSSSKKFLKVCGTIIQRLDPESNWVEVMASSKIFERKVSDINKFEDKQKFIAWPFNHREKFSKKS
jgi:hypothetical protein